MTSKRFPTSKRIRWAISLALLFHLLALFLPPLSFQTRGPLGQSPSIATVLRPVESYGEFLYLNRGYAFFAPDPGPSHLIQVAIRDPGGDNREMMIPDRREQWPRLLYHRHFMLTEFLYDIYQPPLRPEELALMNEEEVDYWRRSRSRYEHFRRSMVEHLQFANPDCEVAIRRIEHLIPDLNEYRRNPVSLTDQASYRVLLDQSPDLGVIPRDDDAEPLPEAIVAPSGAAALRRSAGEPARAAGETARASGEPARAASDSAAASEQADATAPAPTNASSPSAAGQEDGAGVDSLQDRGGEP